MLKFFIDMDGVLVDFVGGVLEIHSMSDKINQADIRTYELERYMNMSVEEMWAPLTMDFWANLDKTSIYEELIAWLNSITDRLNCCVLSSPGNPDGAAGKLRWLEHNMPLVYRDRRYLIGPAKEFCASDESILIDDNDENCLCFIAHGGYAILVPRPWNSLRDCQFSRMSSVKQQYQQIRRKIDGR